MSSNNNKIASQFDLPERQAKVKQLLKINQAEEEVWCVCRSSDCSTFMIGCDNCDEWYHGNCIGLKQKDAKKIKKFFCVTCRSKDSSLEVQYKSQYAEEMQRKKQKRMRVVDDDERHDSEPTQSKKQKTSDHHKPSSETPKQKPSETSARHTKSVPRQASTHNIKADSTPTVDSRNYQQCFGPGCTEAARLGSKYCSDDCGMNLARNRIFELLPWRVSQWVAKPSVADTRNHKELEIIRQERQSLHVQLENLDKKKSKLEDLIRRAKSVLPLSEATEGVDASEESAAEGATGKNSDEAQVDCVSCGNPQAQKTAFRHMERCFARLECQTTCWSMMSTRIEGDSMLCDYYSPQLNMYCKRLKHICPEHYKEEKLETEVCGCPLIVPGGLPAYEVCYHGGCESACSEQKDFTDFCRLLKSRCNRHPSWERVRRAHIDLERFKLWSRLEELMERENQIRFALSQRAGVVALMLNETTDCNPDVPLTVNAPPSSISSSSTIPQIVPSSDLNAMDTN